MTREEKKRELVALFTTGAMPIGELIDACFAFADANPRWISVEDELPTRNMIDEYHESDLSPEVLVCTDKGDVIMTYYDHMFKEWCCNLGTSFTHNVTHWMPTPQPPEKGGEQ